MLALAKRSDYFCNIDFMAVMVLIQAALQDLQQGFFIQYRLMPGLSLRAVLPFDNSRCA